MRADKKDAQISAEITKRELTRKYEAVAIFAPVEVEVALLQSGCNRKFSDKATLQGRSGNPQVCLGSWNCKTK